MRKHQRTKTQKVHKKKVPTKKAKNKTAFLSRVDNSKDIDTILSKNKIVQDLLGFSGDSLGKLFETAIAFLRQHRFDEAVQGFQLLSRVNPFVSDFWLGLGLAHQGQGSFEQALSAYLVAETMDPMRPDLYAYAIDCCLEMRNIPQAQAIVNLGTFYANKQKRNEEGKILLTTIKELQARINAEK